MPPLSDLASGAAYGARIDGWSAWQARRTLATLNAAVPGAETVVAGR